MSCWHINIQGVFHKIKFYYLTHRTGLLYVFFRQCPQAMNNPSGDYHVCLHAASIYKRICSSRSDLWPISADLHSPSVFVNWADIRCIKNKNKRLKDPEIAQKFFLEMREQTIGSRAVITCFFPRKCQRSSLAEYRDVTREEKRYHFPLKDMQIKKTCFDKNLSILKIQDF